MNTVVMGGYEVINLGKFELKSDTMRLSDPCYGKNVLCAGSVKAEPGIWEAIVKKSDAAGWGNRCCELMAVYTGINFPSTPEEIKWEKVPGEFGVDSGQFGFFDDKFYSADYELAEGEDTLRDIDIVGDDDFNDFYALCAGITLGQVGAGVISTGVVSSSGFGDGGYQCFGIKNKDGKYVAMKVVFIWPEELDDEEGEVVIGSVNGFPGEGK